MDSEINSNKNDYITSILKSLSGAIPFAGSFVGELFTYIIPNQRIERITHFIEELNNRCDNIESILQNDYNKIYILEEGVRISSKTNSKEKIEWLSSVVSKGIIDDISINLTEKILQIIEAIDNEQFIILYYYYKYTSRSIIDKEAFKDKYPDILRPSHLFMTNRELSNINESKFKYNTNSLFNMGLINYSSKIDSFTNNAYSGNDSEKFRDVYDKLNLVYKELDNIVNKTDFNLTELGVRTIEAIIDPKIESKFEI